MGVAGDRTETGRANLRVRFTRLFGPGIIRASRDDRGRASATFFWAGRLRMRREKAARLPAKTRSTWQPSPVGLGRLG